MNTKLRIDLTQGILEVEGSETFVKNIYNDFKSHFITESTSTAEEKKNSRTRRTKSTDSPAKTPPPAPQKKPAPAAPPAPVPGGYTLLKLTLGATKRRTGLMEFTDAKVPITNEERNLVFLYYLQQMLKLEEVGVDHIYTCYKHVKARVPVDIEHSLKNTQTQHDWLTIDEAGHINITKIGIDYVERNLPIKK